MGLSSTPVGVHLVSHRVPHPPVGGSAQRLTSCGNDAATCRGRNARRCAGMGPRTVHDGPLTAQERFTPTSARRSSRPRDIGNARLSFGFPCHERRDSNPRPSAWDADLSTAPRPPDHPHPRARRRRRMPAARGPETPSSWLVGRKRVSLTSVSSAWLTASITMWANVWTGRAISIASRTIATTSGLVMPTGPSPATEQPAHRADGLVQELCLQTHEFLVVDIPGILQGDQPLNLIDKFGPRQRRVGAA